jgi:hypothetical protein
MVRTERAATLGLAVCQSEATEEDPGPQRRGLWSVPLVRWTHASARLCVT